MSCKAPVKEVASRTTNSLPFSNGSTCRHLIVAYVVWSNTGSVTVSDSNGNAYRPRLPRRAWGNTWRSQVFYAKNIPAAPTR